MSYKGLVTKELQEAYRKFSEYYLNGVNKFFFPKKGDRKRTLERISNGEPTTPKGGKE